MKTSWWQQKDKLKQNDNRKIQLNTFSTSKVFGSIQNPSIQHLLLCMDDKQQCLTIHIGTTTMNIRMSVAQSGQHLMEVKRWKSKDGDEKMKNRKMKNWKANQRIKIEIWKSINGNWEMETKIWKPKDGN